MDFGSKLKGDFLPKLLLRGVDSNESLIFRIERMGDGTTNFPCIRKIERLGDDEASSSTFMSSLPVDVGGDRVGSSPVDVGGEGDNHGDESLRTSLPARTSFCVTLPRRCRSSRMLLPRLLSFFIFEKRFFRFVCSSSFRSYAVGRRNELKYSVTRP